MIQKRPITNPFPGLRPFETEEYRLFFGREGQADELVARLSRSRFLAVVGTSGSGKSSLIRAGLMPALRGGMMKGAGVLKSDWTNGDPGVVGIDAPRLFSCHETQRTGCLSAGRSAIATSRVFVVASISAGAVIHDGSLDFACTRSSSDGT